MPALDPHFRFAMGENDDSDSYIFQSVNIILWSNVPGDLEYLLNTVPVRDVLDFSLGCDGRYYIKWVQCGQIKRKLSKGLWQDLQIDPNETLDRLSLGPGYDFWYVGIDGNGPYSICAMDSSLVGQIRKLEQSWDYDDFLFVSLGADDTFSYNVGGATYSHSTDPTLKEKYHLAKSQGKKVQSVVLSPYTTAYWFMLYDDGTYNVSLPNAWQNHIFPHMLLEHSLNRRSGNPLARASEPLTVRAPAPVQPSQPSAPLRRLYSGSPEYDELSSMLLNGWKHPHKGNPWLARIYAIDLPPSLLQRYNSYRTLVAQNIGIRDLNERNLFHGTPRACCVGDPENTQFLCTSASCNLCLIIRTSFKVARAGTAPGRNFMRFGRGLYTTSVSSKADDYNASQSNTGYKAMLVAKVVLGRGCPLIKNSKELTQPPRGYHSVIGEVGHDLNYNEQVVYCDEAIRPAYLIIYEA
ncbi:hypothetical protein FRB93_007493 [Tulasnella sp. JGI-2019a]|nr:hypothetical protein FRB93_007493 [Tulasnella sp. JGI-2019a]